MTVRGIIRLLVIIGSLVGYFAWTVVHYAGYWTGPKSDNAPAGIVANQTLSVLALIAAILLLLSGIMYFLEEGGLKRNPKSKKKADKPIDKRVAKAAGILPNYATTYAIKSPTPIAEDILSYLHNGKPCEICDYPKGFKHAIETLDAFEESLPNSDIDWDLEPDEDPIHPWRFVHRPEGGVCDCVKCKEWSRLREAQDLLTASQEAPGPRQDIRSPMELLRTHQEALLAAARLAPGSWDTPFTEEHPQERDPRSMVREASRDGLHTVYREVLHDGVGGIIYPGGGGGTRRVVQVTYPRYGANKGKEEVVYDDGTIEYRRMKSPNEHYWS